ncbi:MAG: hypothetical protein JKY65_27425 [Planctomycetes bacterium]|nr:hypothetical protein [Planctomycetota bacterium]
MSWFSPVRPVLPPLLDLLAENATGDLEAEEQRLLVAAHVQHGKPRRIEVPPDAKAERGPACPACAGEVTRAAALVACPRCLGVFHRACWPLDVRCPCEQPARAGVHPLARLRRASTSTIR